MTDAREIIVDELDKCICPADPWADAIISRLTTAGFRILGPDEVDQVTVEKCAGTITTFVSKREAMKALEYHVNDALGGDATVDEFAPFMADHFAAAIRALGRKA